MHPFPTMSFSVLSANSSSIKSFYDGDIGDVSNDDGVDDNGDNC